MKMRHVNIDENSNNTRNIIILTPATLRKPNIFLDKLIASKRFRNNQDLVILPANKI